MELSPQRGQACRVRGAAKNRLGGVARQELRRPEHHSGNQQEREKAQENPTNDRANERATWEARICARSRSPAYAGVRRGRLDRRRRATGGSITFGRASSRLRGDARP